MLNRYYNRLILKKIWAQKKILLFVFYLWCHATLTAQTLTEFQKDSIQERELTSKGREEARNGDFDKALNYLQNSIQLSKKLYGILNPLLLPSYNSLGIIQKNLGKYDDAIKSFDIAEKIIKTNLGENDARLGVVYGNIGNIYKAKGDYVKACEYQESAIRLFNTDTTLFNIVLKDAMYNLANLWVKLKRTNESIDICKNNIKQKPNLRTPHYYALLADIYRNLKSYEIANEYYLKAIQNWIRFYGDKYYRLGDEYKSYAQFLITRKQYDDALKYNVLADSIIQKSYGSLSVNYSDVQINYGDYYLNRDSEATTIKDFRNKKQTNLLKALEYYQKAAVAVTESFEYTDIYALPPLDKTISDVQLLTVLKKKANAFSYLSEIYQSAFDYDNSLKYSINSLHTINACTNLIHRLRIGYLSEESKFLLSENQESTFIDAISTAYKLYKFTGEKQYLRLAFEFTEKSKSASFLASVKDIEAKQFGGIPDSLLSREEELKITISNYKELLFQESKQNKPDSQKTNMYSSKIFQYNEEYKELIKLFEVKYPRYYSFKYENKVINIDELQRKLTNKEAIVEYIVNEPTDTIRQGQLYRFVITKEETNISMTDIDFKYVKDIEYIQKFLSSSNYLYTRKNDFIEYCKSSHDLYKILVEPINGLIAGKHLTIVPDDKLSYIPFDALISEMPDTSRMSFRELKYLVYDYSMNYSYSSTLLYNHFGNEKSNSKSIIAFAPRYDNVLRKTEHDPGIGILQPLPAAREEVSMLQDYYKCDICLDDNATENKFKELAANYDILHLAMHTIVNDSLPMFSKLAFTAPVNGNEEDGWLNTHEIYNMKLNARMTVLSACNTGSGKLQKGEGVMSLARGFLYAGCPSIIMTLWEVEDLSGTEIMRSFYYYLSKGKTKDDALRLAKLKHINNADPLKAHPHYWLGYVNVGNPEKMYRSKNLYFFTILLFAVILVIADHLYRKRRRQQ